MSPVMKGLLVATGVVILVAYVAVVELGINAGRIHFGVTVRGMDVGGLTVEEAVQRLEGRAALLDSKPIVFGSEGLGRVSVFPSELRWMGSLEKTAEEAAAIPLRVSGLGSRSRPAGAVGNAAEHILLPE